MHHALDNKEAVQKLWFLCIMRLSTKVALSEHQVFVNMEAV